MTELNTHGYLYISSDDRKINQEKIPDIDYYGQFNVNNISKIALRSCDIVVGIDNINDLNNKAYLDDTIQTFPITLTNGNYTYVELRDEIKIKLDAIGLGAWTVTFSGNRYIIQAPTIMDQFKFIVNPLTSHKDWADMIGMPKKDNIFKNIYTGNIANIAYTDVIYITSSKLHNYKNMNDYTSTQRFNNILGIVYVNSNQSMGNDKDPDDPINIITPKHITTYIDYPKWVNIQRNEDINSIDIKLLDSSGFILPNNDVSYTIELLTY